eukprot:c1958_g1_i1.p1 GENE.c1958_g1_i1~~c1958_g1_i1.p1  ORF type:complete len:102 (+),score=22.21 c1958_g1_i1:109-414(+)
MLSNIGHLSDAVAQIATSVCYNASTPQCWRLLCPAVKLTKQYYDGQCLSAPVPVSPCGDTVGYLLFTAGWMSLVALSTAMFLFCFAMCVRSCYRHSSFASS